MSPDEARQLLAEYLEVLAWEKADLYRDGSEDSRYKTTLRLWGAVYKLGAESVLGEERFAETMSELRRRVKAGKAPPAIVRAFIVAHKDLLERRRQVEEQVRQELQTCSPDELRSKMALRDATGRPLAPKIVRDSVAAVLEERVTALAAPAGVSTRARESRPRRSRSAGRSSAGSDDGPSDLGRRCPRCGGAARPLLPSALWRCDRCLRRSWERHVQLELERMFAELERILRGAA